MTMSAPGFTAEDSLHATRGHYRTSTRTPGPSAHAVGTIRLSEINVPGEVIEIEDDAPWSPPSWGGHTGPGTTGPPPETGGGEPGGGGGVPSKKDPKIDKDKPQEGAHGCSINQIRSKKGKKCQKRADEDMINGNTNLHYPKCTGDRIGKVAHPKMECCQDDGDVTVCEPL